MCAFQLVRAPAGVAKLHNSKDFRNLLTDLGGVGGWEVAILLDRAAAEAAEPLGSQPQAASYAADICRDVCWEKLHTGNWQEVSIVWRNAYTAASVLCAYLPTAGCGPQSAGTVQQNDLPADSRTPAAATHAPAPNAVSAGEQMSQPAQQESYPATADEGTAAAADADIAKYAQSDPAEMMRQLDMAALMGGPLFRSLLDACISEAQAACATIGTATGCPTDISRHDKDGPSEKRPRLASFDAAAPEQHSEAGGAPEPESGPDADDQPTAPLSSPAGDNQPPMSQAVPLPPGSVQSSTLLPRRPLPSLESFFAEHMNAPNGGQPVVITGGIVHWPAQQRWPDLNYLKRAAGARTVPVEVGSNYLAAGWGQRLMTLSDFIDRHIQGPNSPDQLLGYLAQHELFEQIPQLRADIREPEYCAFSERGHTSVNAWFGPPGTVTPTHTDPYHNLLAQVVGRKYVRLYHPHDSTGLYPFQEGFTTNCSQVDMDAPDAAKFPLFSQLQHCDAILEPGDMLYIPPGWWHFVKSLDVSFSVSFWF